MKKLLIPIVICIELLVSIQLCAQSITPEISSIEQDGKYRPCLLVRLDPEPTTLKKAWIDFVKSEYDFKLKGMGWLSKKDLLSAKEVVVGKLSSKTMNFYTYIVEDVNGSEMKIFASLGYDIYIDEEHYPAEYRALDDMLTLFLKQYLPKYYTKAIDETADRINDLKKEIKDFNEDIDSKTDNITKLNKVIASDKNGIEVDAQRLKVAELKLKGRQEKLERVQAALRNL